MEDTAYTELLRESCPPAATGSGYNPLSSSQAAREARESYERMMNGYIFDAICPSTVTASREVPNGEDDYDAEVEDEYEVDELTD